MITFINKNWYRSITSLFIKYLSLSYIDQRRFLLSEITQNVYFLIKNLQTNLIFIFTFMYMNIDIIIYDFFD